MNILAGQTQDLRFDPEAKAYKPFAEVSNDSPTFTIRTLDYWQWQEVLAKNGDAVGQTRIACQLGLVAIDGDAEKANAFLAAPDMYMINPLFQIIVATASGN